MWNSISGRIRSSSVHCAVRSIVLAFGAIVSLYVAVPDYPYGVPLWQSLCLDANGFWHELFYIWTFVAAVVFASILWQLLQTVRNAILVFVGVMKKIEKDL